MVKGDLKIYAIDVVKGDVAYASAISGLTLGGLSNPNIGTLTLNLPKPKTAPIDKVLLEIGITSKDYPERMRWRLWFDGIAVSREYRPKSIAFLSNDEGYYSKAVFDITPIYKPSDIHKVTIAYEGSNPIKVDHVALFAIYRVPDSTVSYAFVSGALSLEPGDTYSLDLKLDKLPEKVNQASLRIVLGFNNKNVQVDVDVNGVQKRIGGFIGVDEFVFENLPVSTTYRISFKHVEGSKPVKLSTIVLSLAYRLLPDIKLDIVERKDDKVIVRLENVGSIKPDKLMLLAISAGNVLERLMLEPLEPGESREVEVKSVSGKRVTVRVVWVKHGKPYHREVRL